MGFSASSCRWTTAPVEENDFNIVFIRNLGQLFFGFINFPVGFQITAIFCSIGKTEHNRLRISASFQMFSINGKFIKRFHHLFTGIQTFHRFKKRNNIDIDFLLSITAKSEHSEDIQHIFNLVGIGNNVSTESSFAVFLLNLSNVKNILQSIFGNAFEIFGIQNDIGFQKPLQFVLRRNIF